jgi:nucleoside-diphosphate-sugar epimerase
MPHPSGHADRSGPGALPGCRARGGRHTGPGAVGRLCARAEGATVFHLAGIIHPARISDLFEINTDGTRHVLAAAAAAGVRRVVTTSSNSPAGVSRDPSARFDERSPYRPYMAYGRSKKLMEDALNWAHTSGAVDATILRPCWFYGPDQPLRQSLLFKTIREGKAPIVGDGGRRAPRRGACFPRKRAMA